MCGLRVVQAIPEYLDAMEKIETESFESPWTRKMLLSHLDEGNRSFCLVALESEKLVGYIFLMTVLDEGHVANLAVLPGYRRQGVAIALLNSAIARLRKMGIVFLMLEVRCSNHAAISLYKKFGFISVGRRPGYYTEPPEDALLMTLSLACEESNNDGIIL